MSERLGGGIYCWVKVRYSIPCQRGWGVIYCWVKVKFSIPCQRGWGGIYCWVKVKYSIPCQRGWGGIYCWVKVKDRVTQTPLKTGVNSGAPLVTSTSYSFSNHLRIFKIWDPEISVNLILLIFAGFENFAAKTSKQFCWSRWK
jgi:hypothetical protein